MAHFGFLTLSVPGHLFPATALAHELQSRGHQVTFFCFADARPFLEQLQLNPVVIAADAIPLGYNKKVIETLGKLSGSKGVAFTIKYLCETASATFADLPAAIQATHPDALILDQFATAGGTIAEHLHLPCVHIAAALLANVEDGLPPVNVAFGPEQTLFARLRNRIATALVKRVCRPLRATVNDQRRQWNLPPYTEFFNERLASGPQISQQPAGFEFPRKTLPANFHFVGPLHRRDARATIRFLWDRLDSRPLVYASMGTLQNGLDWVFRTFAEACDGLDVQLVLSLGGNLDPAGFDNLPGGPIVVRFAPQLQLLERATLCITHAGLNTALESLACGVPMIAIPITNDQPAVAARIVWTGCGIHLPLQQLTAASLRSAIHKVLTIPSYRHNAQIFQHQIASTDSLTRACEIAESVLRDSRSRPVQ